MNPNNLLKALLKPLYEASWELWKNDISYVFKRLMPDRFYSGKKIVFVLPNDIMEMVGKNGNDLIIYIGGNYNIAQFAPNSPPVQIIIAHKIFAH